MFCSRITIKSQSLADAVWERIKDYLSNIVVEGDPHKVHIHGAPMLMKGTWKPLGLNNVGTLLLKLEQRNSQYLVPIA